jgi:sulfite exporter TauE/SafE
VIQTIVEGFLLGLATGHLCVATCGPIYAPFLMQKNQGGLKGSLLSVLKISAGRFIAYGLFGLVAGAIGQEVSGVNRTWFTIVSFLLLSVMLLNSAFNARKKNHATCGVTRWGKVVSNPLLLGIVTGINFCPSFLIALTEAFHLSGPISGFFLFTSFFVGTNVYMLPLSIFGVLGNKNYFRYAAIAASLIVATIFTFRAGKMIRNELMPDPRGVITLLDEQPLHILTNREPEFTALANHLRDSFDKNVSLGVDVPESDSILYLLVDNEFGFEKAKALKQENRFVVLLPTQFDSPESITHFLSEYRFFFDTKTGEFFPMEKHG